MRLTMDDIKGLVVQRQAMKAERDQIISGVDLGNVEQGLNPMAMMGLVSKVNDFKRAYELTKEIERISDALASELVQMVAENGN